MGDHFKKVCRLCGTVITQCRCMALDKRVEYGICAACVAKALETGGPVD